MPTTELDFGQMETAADKAGKKRVIVRKRSSRFGKAPYELLIGSWNINQLIYEGSSRQCQGIKAAFLATGDFIDESEKTYES